MIEIILQIILIAGFIYLSIIILYIAALSIAGSINRKDRYTSATFKRRIAILIPAYKEDLVILETIRQALKQDYPQDKFHVFVAAHFLKDTTLDQLRKMPVTMEVIESSAGSKALSLQNLFKRIPENQFDVALILDADNLLAGDALEKINHAFDRGFRGVQIHRMAKNLNTGIAILDAISEEINNHIFRKGQRALGLSASTIGSGMAFGFEMLRKIYYKPGIIFNPACDREVDFETMKEGVIIEFIDDAIVYDEKVQSSEVYTNQRKRWMESQASHLSFFLGEHRHIQKNLNYWNRFFTNSMPPRVIILASFFIPVIFFLADKYIGTDFLRPSIPWWGLVLVVYLLSLFNAIPRKFYTLQTIKALRFLPILTFSFIKAALHIRRGRKEFIHTPKSFPPANQKEDMHHAKKG